MLRVPVDTRRSLASELAKVKTVPAPVGGWNARDSLADMPPTDAVSLINWMPRTTYCEFRGGGVNWATGLPSLPQSLMPYNGPAGTGHLFAAVSSGIYDVTVAGAVGASVRALTNAKCQSVNFAAGSGAEILYVANGVDTLATYDGTTWANSTITGVTLTNIINLCSFKQRLFLIEKGKLSFWYLPISSIAGAAQEFPLNQIFPRGGFCMAAASWSIDAGSGIDDFFVCITSEGELAIFKGTDPGNASAWALVGVWFVGRPIGRRCFTKWGGDLAIILQTGVFPMTQAMLSSSIGRFKALSDKINQAFTVATATYGSIFGWELMPFPQQNALLVNVPNAEGGLHQQYVMNTQTKAWTQFNGWDAETFAVYNGELYYATGTKTVKAWTGAADPGNINIQANAKTAFNYFNSQRRKLWRLAKPILLTSGPVSYMQGINVDFEDHPPANLVNAASTSGSLWDSGTWDSAIWGFGVTPQRNWTGVQSEAGRCMAYLLQISTKVPTIQWPATEFLYEEGGLL
jgi:hypothetical protein